MFDYHRRTLEFAALCGSLPGANNVIRIRYENPWGDEHIILNFHGNGRIALEVMQDGAMGANANLRLRLPSRWLKVRQ